jgi:protein ImuB
MFACIHGSADPARLIECAQAFSPVVEQTAPDIAVLDASGLDRIHGPAHEIAAAIARRARELGLEANVAIASNPDAAICAARGFSGTSVVPHGDEAKFLESLPLHLLGADEETLETFDRWGVRTFRDLALLPTIGLAGRLGPEGVRLQQLARGELERPLAPLEEPLEFQEEISLDDPVDLLEPLSFVLARLLNEICRRLAERGLATNEIRLRLLLEDRSEHARTLRLPVPMCDPRTFLKLLLLDLGGHAPAAPVVRADVAAEPVKPRLAQEGLFVPLAPEPEKLELTLARVAVLVGEENIGSPELIDTHRPDAFVMRKFASAATGTRAKARGRLKPAPQQQILAFRIYRPPRAARVQVESGRPAFVLAEEIRGKVIAAAGPWRTSGDWWTAAPWDRDEWEISLSDGALYRIYCEHATGRWFVEGSFD